MNSANDKISSATEGLEFCREVITHVKNTLHFGGYQIVSMVLTISDYPFLLLSVFILFNKLQKLLHSSLANEIPNVLRK